MAPHSSTLAWKIPWTEDPGGPQSMGSLRVGHDLATKPPNHHSCFHIYIYIISFTEKAMAPHSHTLAWKIPWTEEPGRLHSMGLLGVRHD